MIKMVHTHGSSPGSKPNPGGGSKGGGGKGGGSKGGKGK